MGNRIKRWMVHLVWLGAAGSLTQAASAQGAATASDALHAMADRAGVIFVGTVTGIRRAEGDGHSSGAVEVTFAVEQAVKGCTPGEEYSLREWGGLWANNDHRYQVGRRLLMLLNAPGPGGFSAPVAGLQGAIPVLGTAPAVGPASTTAASAAEAQTADLRWISAVEVARPQGYATPLATLSGVHGAPLRATARVQGSGQAGSNAMTAATVADANGVAGEPIRNLLSRLAEWEASRAN